jgi:ferredoxin-nitrate reductase
MIRSVCGYCGVGCGLEYDKEKLVGSIAYPTNEGAVCAKGVSELLTIQTPSRLLRPHIRQTINDPLEITTWDHALERVTKKINETPPEKIGFYLSGQLLNEDYYVANKLAKGFIGTNNVDTNSRACMASAVVAHKKAFGADFVPVAMEDIFHSNLLILVGANTAEAHVVFHNKIKKAKKQGLKVVVIDPRETETTKIADLHLPIRPNGDIDLFNIIMHRLISEDKIDHAFIQNHTNDFDKLTNKFKRLPLTKLRKRTGLSDEQIDAFYDHIIAADRFITGWTMGINQSVQGVDKNLAIINFHLITGQIYQKGSGPFSLTGQPNAMGGREVGGLATMLAVHLDFDPKSIAKVAKFWKTDKIQPKAGLTATQMLEADLDLLIIAHTDPVYHLPNRNRVEKLIQKVKCVVEINAYENSETAKFAHIRLPAAPWGEKEGTQTNLDRTITRQERLTRISVDCKPDWEIFTLIAQRLGYEKAFDFTSPKAIFEEYQAMTKLSQDKHLNIFECDYDALQNSSFRWGEAVIKAQRFFTPNGKANIIYTENKTLSERPSLKYPYTLLTGRIRDQWHSGTKTAVVDKLHKHKPLSFVEIHPDDAKKEQLNDGDQVKISSERGELETTVKITTTVAQGTLFIPVTDRTINYVTNNLLDPLSKEPDYNHSAVAISLV